MMLEEIHKIFQENAELFTIAGFLAGTLIGNHFSIEKDRRKEFNDIVCTLYRRIKYQISIDDPPIEEIDADTIERYIPWYSRLCFRYYVKQYNKHKYAVTQYPTSGDPVINIPAKIATIKYASHVLRFLKPR